MLDGASREEAATIGGMDRQTLRDWVIRFNEQGPDGLINIPSPGEYPFSGSATWRRDSNQNQTPCGKPGAVQYRTKCWVF